MSPVQSIAIFCCCVALVQGHPGGRIVGGSEAAEGQFPYQISLRRNDRHICGGSIISRNFILTAAHCVTERKDGRNQARAPEEYTVLAGTVDRVDGGILRQVASIKVHENYLGVLNDVALLKLKQPLNLSKTIQTIPLASEETPSESPVVISGWGLLKQNGRVPILLQWNNLTSLSKARCALKIGIFSDALICLAHEEDNGACNGDSGGPAVYNNELVGVAGFVFRACGTSKPDGYAKVFFHLNWIKENSDVDNELRLV